MKIFRPRFVLLAATLIALAFLAGWHFRPRGVTPAIRSDFEWFQKLGFPDVKTLPYVRVATGNPVEDDTTRSNSYENAFLLATNATTFTVLAPDLSIETYTNTPPRTLEYKRIGFEPLDFQNAVRTEIVRLEKPPGRVDNSSDSKIQTFALAWACWRRGLDREARRLYDAAGTMPKEYQPRHKLRFRKVMRGAWEWIQEKWDHLRNGNNNTTPATPDPTLRQIVETELAQTTYSRANDAFEDKSITRAQLLATFKEFLSHYPGSEYETNARHTAKILEQMIKEDRVHVPVDPSRLLTLPLKDRVRELIFELRDQNGEQLRNDISVDPDGSTNTPEAQLFAIGYAAVPQLIEALDSETLTRWAPGWGNGPSHVTDVGYCVEMILEHMSGRSFSRAVKAGSNGPPASPSPLRSAAQAWWDEFQRKGEKQMLIEAVSSGGDDAPNSANILCKKYPAVAAQTLINGIRACNTASAERNRIQLIQSLVPPGGPEATEFLHWELTNSGYLAVRVEAAYGLRKQASAEACSRMIAEWNKLPEPIDESVDGVQSLMLFLVTSDSVETMSALQRDFTKRSVDMRLAIVEKIGDGFQYDFDHETIPLSEAALAAQEAFLVRELNDTEDTGTSGSRDGVNYTHPRICDMAAWYLSERCPARYRFDIRNSLRNRELQRITCVNTWRSAHNLPLEPLPDTNLPKLPRQHSIWITRIEFATNGVTPSPAFAAHLGRLKGRPLRDDDVVKLLCDFAKKPERGSAGLQFIASKDEDLTGVQITVRLIPKPPGGASEDYATSEDVQINNESVLSSTGGTTLETCQDPEQWDDLADAIREAISAPPETPFTVSISLKPQK